MKRKKSAYSPKARAFLKKKVPILLAEGYEQPQAVAVALSMARKAGLKVPKRNPAGDALFGGDSDVLTNPSSDEEIRALERQFAQGDHSAELPLAHALLRAGKISLGTGAGYRLTHGLLDTLSPAERLPFVDVVFDASYRQFPAWVASIVDFLAYGKPNPDVPYVPGASTAGTTHDRASNDLEQKISADTNVSAALRKVFTQAGAKKGDVKVTVRRYSMSSGMDLDFTPHGRRVIEKVIAQGFDPGNSSHEGIYPENREDRSDSQSDYFHPGGVVIRAEWVMPFSKALLESAGLIAGSKKTKIAAREAASAAVGELRVGSVVRLKDEGARKRWVVGSISADGKQVNLVATSGPWDQRSGRFDVGRIGLDPDQTLKFSGKSAENLRTLYERYREQAGFSARRDPTAPTWGGDPGAPMALTPHPTAPTVELPLTVPEAELFPVAERRSVPPAPPEADPYWRAGGPGAERFRGLELDDTPSRGTPTYRPGAVYYHHFAADGRPVYYEVSRIAGQVSRVPGATDPEGLWRWHLAIMLDRPLPGREDRYYRDEYTSPTRKAALRALSTAVMDHFNMIPDMAVVRIERGEEKPMREYMAALDPFWGQVREGHRPPVEAGAERFRGLEFDNPARGTVSAGEVEGLPVGTIVCPLVGGLPRSVFLVVVPGGVVPKEIVPPRAGEYAVDGEPIAQWGYDKWAVVRIGSGQIPAKSTVDTAVARWWKSASANPPRKKKPRPGGQYEDVSGTLPPDQDVTARRVLMPQASWDMVMKLTDELRAQRGIEAQPAEILAVVIESGMPYVTGVPPSVGDLEGWVARRVVLRREVADRLAALGAAHGQSEHAAATAAVLAGLSAVRPVQQNPPADRTWRQVCDQCGYAHYYQSPVAHRMPTQSDTDDTLPISYCPDPKVSSPRCTGVMSEPEEIAQNPFFAPPALQYVAFANPYYYGSR